MLFLWVAMTSGARAPECILSVTRSVPVANPAIVLVVAQDLGEACDLDLGHGASCGEVSCVQNYRHSSARCLDDQAQSIKAVAPCCGLGADLWLDLLVSYMTLAPVLCRLSFVAPLAC